MSAFRRFNFTAADLVTPDDLVTLQKLHPTTWVLRPNSNVLEEMLYRGLDGWLDNIPTLLLTVSLVEHATVYDLLLHHCRGTPNTLFCKALLDRDVDLSAVSDDYHEVLELVQFAEWRISKWSWLYVFVLQLRIDCAYGRRFDVLDHGGCRGIEFPKSDLFKCAIHGVTVTTTVLCVDDASLSADRLVPQLVCLYFAFIELHHVLPKNKSLRSLTPLQHGIYYVKCMLGCTDGANYVEAFVRLATDTFNAFWPQLRDSMLLPLVTMRALMPYRFTCGSLRRFNEFLLVSLEPRTTNDVPTKCLAPRYRAYVMGDAWALFPRNRTDAEARELVRTRAEEVLRLLGKPADWARITDAVLVPTDDPSRCFRGGDSIVYRLSDYPILANPGALLKFFALVTDQLVLRSQQTTKDEEAPLPLANAATKRQKRTRDLTHQ